MRILLHVCCGPCASGAVPFWQREGADVVGFFHNPNIHPFLEYRRRLTGAEEVAGAQGFGLLMDEEYDPQAWFASVATGEPGRCARCIAARLDRTAARAAAEGIAAFSTTLAISPWQDHKAIEVEGRLAARRHHVEFLYRDLRPQYAESRRRSKELGIYRQKYCGCLLSEWERYRDGSSRRG